MWSITAFQFFFNNTTCELSDKFYLTEPWDGVLYSIYYTLVEHNVTENGIVMLSLSEALKGPDCYIFRGILSNWNRSDSFGKNRIRIGPKYPNPAGKSIPNLSLIKKRIKNKDLDTRIRIRLKYPEPDPQVWHLVGPCWAIKLNPTPRALLNI